MAKSRYRKQVCFGYDATGRRIRKWITANTQAELAEKISQAQKEIELTPNTSEITFKAYSDKWLQVYKSNKAINTYAGYQFALTKCFPLETLPLRNITKTDLQMVINANAEHPATCVKIRLALRQIFDAAVNDGIIATSPAARLDVPSHKAAEKRALTYAEREAVKTVELRPSDRLFLDLLYYCGLRRGEALAVTRSDFDFKTLLLTVNKSIAYDREKPTVKDTKTHVVRYVPIPKQKVKEWNDTLQKMPFAPYSNQSRSVTRHMWKRIESSINVKLGGSKDIIALHLTPHMLRHDYATRLYYVDGISDKKKASLLGHSEYLFQKLYSHIDDEKEDLERYQNAMNW